MERGRVGILLLRDNSFSEEPQKIDRPVESVAGCVGGVDDLYAYGYLGASRPDDFRQIVREIYGVGHGNAEKPLENCVVIADKECPKKLLGALSQLESKMGLSLTKGFDVLGGPVEDLDDKAFGGWLSTRTLPSSVEDTFDSLLDEIDFGFGDDDSDDGAEDDYSEAPEEQQGEPEAEPVDEEPEDSQDGLADESDDGDDDESESEGEEAPETPELKLPSTLTEEEIREAEERDLEDLPEEVKAGFVGGDLDEAPKPVGGGSTATPSFAVDEERRLARHKKRVSRLVGLDEEVKQVSVPMKEMNDRPDGLPKDEASSESPSEEAPLTWEDEGGAVAPSDAEFDLDDDNGDAEFDFNEGEDEDESVDGEAGAGLGEEEEAPETYEGDEFEFPEDDAPKQDDGADAHWDDDHDDHEAEVEAEAEAEGKDDEGDPEESVEPAKPKGRKKSKPKKESPVKGRNDVVDPEEPVSYKKEPMSTISMSEMNDYGSIENEPRAASNEYEVYKIRRHPETRIILFTATSGGSGKTTLSSIFLTADQQAKAMLSQERFGGHDPSYTWLIETDYARPKWRNRLRVTNPELTMTGLIMEMDRRGGNVSDEELYEMALRHSVGAKAVKRGRNVELPSARILCAPTSEEFAGQVDVNMFKHIVQRIVDAITLRREPSTVIIDGPDFAPESIDDLQVRLGNNRADRIFIVADGKDETVREIKEVRSGIINAKNGRIPSGSQDRVQVILNMVSRKRFEEVREQFGDGTIFTPRFGYIKQIGRDNPEEDSRWIGNVDHQDLARVRMTALNILRLNVGMDKISVVTDTLTSQARAHERKVKESQAKNKPTFLGRLLGKI